MLNNVGKIGWIIFGIIAVLVIFFAENIYQNQRCKSVDIQLEKDFEGHLVNKYSIEKLITNNGNNPLLGTKFNLLNLRNLERAVLKNKLIKSCQISRTLGGTLSVKVFEENPIARIISLSGSQSKFSGLYFDDVGRLFPLSNEYTKRVMLVSGTYFVGKKSLKTESDKNILDFITKINDDAYWKANVTHLIIDEDQNIIFLPLIGDFNIEYGIPKADEMEAKLRKLQIFYQKIAPENMEKYKLISVKYQNQIVCQLKQPPVIE
jgi:cell division protein FtsQ